MRVCPACQASCPEANRFCGHCGTALAVECPGCSASNPAENRFCGACGTQLAGNRPATPARDRPALRGADAERRQLTVLHIDLVGSTELAVQLDIEEYRDAMRSYIACVTRAVEAEHGGVGQFAGDGMLAFFGYPRASEDDATRAVRAGLSVAAEVARLEPRPGIALQARVGAATGMMVVGRPREAAGNADQEIFGEAANLAARLESCAPPGTVAVCETTRRLCHAGFAFRDSEPVQLKGFDRPVSVALAVGRSEPTAQPDDGSASDGLPLLGRGEDLEVLERRWRDVLRGRGRVVQITGEPGIGKSRLARALTRALGEDRYIPLRYFCSAHHVNSALHPFAGQIEHAAGIRREDTADEKLGKIRALFRSAKDPLAAELMADLLQIPQATDSRLAELSPQERKRRSFDVLLSGLEDLARSAPVLLFFEDAHWVDPTSLELLAEIVERAPALPLLAIVTARPEFTAPWPDHPHVSTIQLKRLDTEQGETLIDKVTGNKRLPPDLVNRILERADGVPLFIEELTKTVLESGELSDAGDGCEVAGTLPNLAIPSTLHASLLARLDRLESVREVAQICAALGREFSFELIRSVSGLDTHTLWSALDQLVDADLIFRRGRPPNAHYAFRHVLLRDAAYSSMLKSRRVELHATIAGILRDQYPDIAAAEPETMAHHLAEAQRHEEAARAWLRAGRVAAHRSANVEAIAHFTRGLDMVRELGEGERRDRLELDLRYALGPSLIAVKGPAAGDSVETFARSRTLCERLGDPEEHLQVMFWLTTASVIRGELPKAAESIGTLLEISEARGDRAALLNARRGCSMIMLFMGRLAEARDNCERALSQFEASTDEELAEAAAAGQDPGVATVALYAWALWALGAPDQGMTQAEAGVGRAESIDHPHSRAYAYYYAAVLRALRGERERAREMADRCHAISEEHGFRHWSGLAAVVRADCDARLDPPAAVPHVDSAESTLASYREAGYQLGTTALYVLLGRTLLALDKPARALESAREGLEIVAENSERLFEAELMRLKAVALAATGPEDRSAEAGELLERARQRARSQGARSIELSVAVSAVRRAEGGRARSEALAGLRSALDGMTDGADLAEVGEAKRLHAARTAEPGDGPGASGAGPDRPRAGSSETAAERSRA